MHNLLLLVHQVHVTYSMWQDCCTPSCNREYSFLGDLSL